MGEVKAKIKDVLKEADKRGLLTLILLTKIDMLCEELKEDVSKTFHSIKLRDMVTINLDDKYILKERTTIRLGKSRLS